jgi:hypothetical protein
MTTTTTYDDDDGATTTTTTMATGGDDDDDGDGATATGYVFLTIFHQICWAWAIFRRIIKSDIRGRTDERTDGRTDAYGSLPDAAIWWCLRTGGGGVLTSFYT